MTSTREPDTREASLAQDLLYAARYYLGGRRGFLVVAFILLVPGLWFGWPALVAAGVAPIMVALAPCAVMCALGLCMGRMGRTAAAGSSDNANAAASPGQAMEAKAQDSPLIGGRCAHCEDVSEARTRPSPTPQIPRPKQEQN